MRAGAYAVVDGAEFPCVADTRGEVVRLLAPGSQPQPEGFERTRQGGWARVVPRASLTRLFYVKTTAVWRGESVDVIRVDGDIATIEQEAWPLPDHPEVYAVENGIWRAAVPVGSLADVVEDVSEVPV